MIAAFRAEWLKVSRRPATVSLAAILLGVLVFFVYLPEWFFFDHASASQLPGVNIGQALAEFYPKLLIPHFLSGMIGIGGAACLALGVLSLGSDYGWGSIHTITALPPSRLAALGGRLLALAAVILAIDVLLWAAAAALSSTLATIDQQPIAWPPPQQLAAAIGATWLIFSMWCALGVVLAAAFRQPVVPLALGLIYMLVVEGLVINLLGSTGSSGFRNFEKMLPGPNSGALAEAFGHGYIPAGVNVSGPLVGVTQATLVTCAFLVLFCALTALLLTKRDVA